ncbi:MAG: thermonuclease family protein [Clostridium sp.]
MKRILSLIYVFLLVFFFTGCGNINKDSNIEKPSGDNSVQVESTDSLNKNFEKAKVIRVVDGDTVIVNLNGVEEKVRLILVNTPESTKKIEAYGNEASAYTKQVLSVGREVYLEKDVSDRDQYGRLLRYVWLTNPSTISKDNIKRDMFNANLLVDGYAMVSTFPPDVKYKDYFVGYQREAMDKKAGLWSLKEYSDNLDNKKIVYYTKNGKSYHFDRGCKSLQKSSNVIQGMLKEAIDLGKVDPCNLCTK